MVLFIGLWFSCWFYDDTYFVISKNEYCESQSLGLRLWPHNNYDFLSNSPFLTTIHSSIKYKNSETVSITWLKPRWNCIIFSFHFSEFSATSFRLFFTKILFGQLSWLRNKIICFPFLQYFENPDPENIWSGPDFLIFQKSGPNYGPKIRTRTGPMKSGPKYPDHGPD